MDTSTKSDVLATLIDRERPIRFSCSDIAAIAGYHPYTSIIELFDKYLYQDLELLRQIDCKKLGIEVTSIDDEIDGIISKLDVRNQQVLQQILNLIEREEVLQDNEQAQNLLKSISNLLQSNEIKDSVATEELEFLERELEGRVKKQYGVNSENNALERYEAMTGFKVVERNETTHYLEVPPLVVDLTASCDGPTTTSDEKDSDSMVCAPPQTERKATCEKKPNIVDATSILMASARRNCFVSLSASKRKLDSSSSKKSLSNNRDDTDQFPAKKSKKTKPAFCLIGKVDGISYQLDTSGEDASRWKPTKVVVEVKSRVFRAKDPPPLYEQIQLVSYMVMLNCRHGDLVQSVRTSSQTVSIPPIATTTATDESIIEEIPLQEILCKPQLVTVSGGVSSESNFKVSRVTLNAPPYYHQFHWDTVIIPRLHVFSDAIIAVRKNDDIRASYLLAEDDVRLAFIHHLCPYFTS
jgi:hypothetical protein